MKTLRHKVALGFIIAAAVVVFIAILEFYFRSLPTGGAIFNLSVFILLFLFIRREIRQRKRAQNSLRESEARFRTLVQHAGDIIYSTDLKGHFTFMNPAIERLMGYQPEGLLGKHFLVLVPESWHDRVAQFYRRQLQEQIANTFYFFPVRRKDGSEMWIAQTTHLIVEGGAAIGAEAIARDVTHRKEFEDDLARTRDSALESSRLKSEFLANMSHEIRTPMNGIIGMTSMLADTRLDQEQRHFVRRIRESADSLLSIINDILDFSKLEARKIEIDAVDFELNPLIEGVLDLFVEATQSKDLELSLIIEPDVPAFFHADSVRLRQILINLIGNAVKFTAQGEVSLKVNLVSQSQAPTVCRFEITDTGIGIPPEAQARLFNAFVQADGSTTRRIGGTGLGLAISKQLVEAMDGQIGVDSSPGKGSAFWFTLPVSKLAKSSAAPEDVVESAPTAPTAGARLLVVEDNLVNQEVARFQIQKIGYQADVAGNGAEALAMVDRHDYALVLM